MNPNLPRFEHMLHSRTRIFGFPSPSEPPDDSILEKSKNPRRPGQLFPVFDTAIYKILVLFITLGAILFILFWPETTIVLLAASPPASTPLLSFTAAPPARPRPVPLVDRAILQRLADLEVSPDPDEHPYFKPAAAATHGDAHPGSQETPGSVSCSRYLQYPWNALPLSTLPLNRRAGVEGPCRLREKFLGQEGVALFDSFSLAYMIPAASGKGWRTRSNSLSSANTFSDAAPEKIVSEDDWVRLKTSLDRAKLTLRVVDVSS